MRKQDCSYWWRKACSDQSFHVQIMWKILGCVTINFKTWPEMSVCSHTSVLQARKRGFSMYKPSWSCHVLLDPWREGEIWQEGSQRKGWCFSHFAGLSVAFEHLPFRGKIKQKRFRGFQKLKEINSSQTSSLRTSLPYSNKQQVADQSTHLGHLNARFRPFS